MSAVDLLFKKKNTKFFKIRSQPDLKNHRNRRGSLGYSDIALILLTCFGMMNNIRN